MGRAKLYQLDAIVLERRDQGEADRIVTVLAADGRRDLLARGVRKPRSRKGGHLELFCRVRLLVSRVKGSWDIISQAEATEMRAALREDFVRATCARYVAELVLRFFEGETETTLFSLVDTTLTLLEQPAEPERVLRWYEQQLLNLAGFRPEWRACVGEREGRPCRVALRPQAADRRPYGIDFERGGALCPDCAVNLGALAGGMLSPSALSWLQAFQREAYPTLAALPFPARTAGELARWMERYISYHLERRLASLRMMREYRAGLPPAGGLVYPEAAPQENAEFHHGEHGGKRQAASGKRPVTSDE